VKEGDEVTQGTLLLELDHEMADIQYDRAKAKDELAMNNFVREQALLRESAVTKQLFDSARYDYSAAHADFRQSEIELDRTFMKSPSDGIIVLKNAIVGNILNSGQTAFMIADIKHAWVSANISEKLIDLVKPGQHVDIFIDQYGGRKFSGNVESIGSVANSIFSLLPISTGSTFTKVIQYIQVKINIDAEDINLIPGENVTVTIRVR
jgi:RND family efflux transporter MFP subunit